MNRITHHQHHATVVLDGDIEWPVIHGVVHAIEDAVDYYHYTLIELRVRSLGGSNEALGYLLERLDAWREQGVRFRTRALGRTSSGAALLVALGDERLADPAATLRFHGASMYRDGDVNAEVSAAVVSRNRSWGPHGNWSQCSVAGFTGKTEQSGSRLEPVPSPLS